MSLSWIFWIKSVAYLAFFIYRQLPKRMVHFFSGDKWWLIKHWFLGRYGSSSSGTRWSIRLLSSCSSWTWRCWALPVWIYCFRRINSCRNTACCYFQIILPSLRRWIQPVSDLHHADHPRVIYSRNQTVLFSVLGVSFYKGVYATTLGCRVLVIIWPVAFLVTTVFLKTRPIWNCPDCLIKPSTFMSVCYIYRKWCAMCENQQAHKVRGTNPQKRLIQK